MALASPLSVGVLDKVSVPALRLVMIADMPLANTVELIAGMVAVIDAALKFSCPAMSAAAMV